MRLFKRLWFIVLFSICLVSLAQETLTWQAVSDGFGVITAIVQAPNDSSRLFVANLSGTVSIIENGELLPEPFLDVSERITTEGFGQGLIGMAFHPDYAENGFFYVSYTPEGNSPILARYTVSPEYPNIAEFDSELIILQVDHSSTWHNGGDIAFGQDGMLYWSMGDGAYERSPAQNFQSHLGAILRLDVDSAEPYAIPVDNPFVNDETVLPELWAKGLRNPWRFSFDQETGDLYIADVGEHQMEEINFQSATSSGGENYGWNLFEGTWLYKGGSRKGMTFPVVEYKIEDGKCSITGGYVYRGENLPELIGKYIFADYCSGTIWTSYQQDSGLWYTAQLMDTSYRITTFGIDKGGEIYLGATNTGTVYQLVNALE